MVCENDNHGQIVLSLKERKRKENTPVHTWSVKWSVKMISWSDMKERKHAYHGQIVLSLKERKHACTYMVCENDIMVR